MSSKIETVGNVVSAYAEALQKDDKCQSAAELLYERAEKIFSLHTSKENKIRCFAQEIDFILSGGADAAQHANSLL